MNIDDLAPGAPVLVDPGPELAHVPGCAKASPKAREDVWPVGWPASCCIDVPVRPVPRVSNDREFAAFRRGGRREVDDRHHHLVLGGVSACGRPFTVLRDDGRPWCEDCYPVWRRLWMAGQRR